MPYTTFQLRCGLDDLISVGSVLSADEAEPLFQALKDRKEGESIYEILVASWKRITVIPKCRPFAEIVADIPRFIEGYYFSDPELLAAMQQEWEGMKPELERQEERKSDDPSA